MSSVLVFEPGGYAFQRGGVPYSAGVIAMPGFAIVRTRFMRPLPVRVQAPVESLQQVVVGQKVTVQVEPTPPWVPVQLAAAVKEQAPVKPSDSSPS